MILKILMLVTLTSYRSVPEQTDSTPYITSRGTRVNSHTLAVSQDLLEGEACYGDAVYIPGFGFKIVEDVMNARHNKSMDMWVASHDQEKGVGVRRLHVYVVRSPNRDCRPRSILYWREL